MNSISIQEFSKLKKEKMNSTTMRAIISTKYGGPEVFQLKEVSKPLPQKKEVLVKIQAASVTTAETMMRTGYPLIGRLFMGLTKPKNSISGTGFAGIIEEVGEEVSRFKKGEKVFGESLDTFGTYAEYISVKEEGIITKMPENISFEEASVIGDGFITSMNFLKELANIQPGQHILINGASGSLGTAAVQLAKEYGAIVTGVCSSKNSALVKSLGADFIIDYTKSDFTENGLQYDVIYDTIGKSSFSKCKNSIVENGIYMTPVLSLSCLIQMIKTSISGGKQVKFSATGALPVAKIKDFLDEAVVLLRNRKISPVMDRSFPLGDVSKAHRYIDQGHKKGNVAIDCLK